MIIKYNELNRVDTKIYNFVLLHGKNEGLKDEKISEFISKNNDNKIFKYDEKEIMENSESFYDNILNGSLFDSGKLIIINRSSDKLIPILEPLFDKNFVDITLIINADVLDKRSKLRLFFEKNKKSISVAFYPDNNETLINLTQSFFNKIKIRMSFENINILVNKCAGDRNYLKNELKKISLFVKNKKHIETDDLMKLINLTENFSINELIDMCLSKNKKKTTNILNENNFGTEDSILIIRTFLNKSKKLLNLLYDYKINKDLNKTIMNAKPPIFWKDKEVIKLQIKNWTPEKIKEVIYNLNKLEVQVKKISFNQLHLISDFILDKSSLNINN